MNKIGQVAFVLFGGGILAISLTLLIDYQVGVKNYRTSIQGVMSSPFHPYAQSEKEICIQEGIPFRTDPVNPSMGFCDEEILTTDQMKALCAKRGVPWLPDATNPNGNGLCDFSKYQGPMSTPTIQPAPTTVQPAPIYTQPLSEDQMTKEQCDQAGGWFRYNDYAGNPLPKPTCDLKCPRENAFWKFVDVDGKPISHPYCEYKGEHAGPAGAPYTGPSYPAMPQYYETYNTGPNYSGTTQTTQPGMGVNMPVSQPPYSPNYQNMPPALVPPPYGQNYQGAPPPPPPPPVNYPQYQSTPGEGYYPAPQGPYQGSNCGPNDVENEYGNCEPIMQQRDREREYKMFRGEILQQTKPEQWLNDLLRELASAQGIKKSTLKYDNIFDAILALMPTGSEAATVIPTVIESQKAAMACFQDKLTKIDEVMTREKITHSSFQVVRDEMRDCYDLKADGGDSRGAFESIGSIRCDGEIKRGIDEFRKRDMREIDRFVKERRGIVDQNAVDQLKSEIEKRLAEVPTIETFNGDCRDRFEALDEVRRNMFERLDEMRRDSQALMDIQSFAKDEAPFIKEDLEKASSRISDEGDKRRVNEALDLINEFLEKYNSKKYDDARDILMGLERYRNVEEIVRRALGKEGSKAYDPDAQFDRFQENLDQSMENIMKRVEEQFANQMARVVGDLTKNIEIMQARITSVTGQLENLAKINLGQLIDQGLKNFQSKVEESIAQQVHLPEKTQQIMLENVNDITGSLNSLSETIAAKLEGSEDQLPPKTQDAYKKTIELISKKPLGPALTEEIVKKLTAIKNAVQNEGTSGLSIENLQKIEILIKDEEEKNNIELVKDVGLYAGVDIVKNGYPPNVWYNDTLIKAGNVDIGGKKYAFISGDKKVTGEPTYIIRPEDPLLYSELSKVGRVFGEAAGNKFAFAEGVPKNPLVPKDLWFSAPWAFMEAISVDAFSFVRPEEAATRGAVAQAFIKALNYPLPPVDEDVCPDVPKNHADAPFWKAMKDLGAIKGDDGTGKCRPADNINRAEAGKIITIIGDYLNKE